MKINKYSFVHKFGWKKPWEQAIGFYVSGTCPTSKPKPMQILNPKPNTLLHYIGWNPTSKLKPVQILNPKT